MRKLVLTALSAGMIGLFAGAAHAAPQAANAPEAPAASGFAHAKVMQHRGQDRRYNRHDRRDQRYDRRNHRDQRYTRGRGHRQNCWRERQRSRFHGRRAIVTVRMCENRRGYRYVVHGSERLVRFVGRSHRRGHRR